MVLFLVDDITFSESANKPRAPGRYLPFDRSCSWMPCRTFWVWRPTDWNLFELLYISQKANSLEDTGQYMFFSLWGPSAKIFILDMALLLWINRSFGWQDHIFTVKRDMLDKKIIASLSSVKSRKNPISFYEDSPNATTNSHLGMVESLSLHYIYIYIFTYTYTHTHIYIYTYVCTCTCICKCICMCICTHTHTHTHIYINNHIQS